MLTMFLHLNKLGLNFLADLFNTGTSDQTSTERTHMKGDAVWMYNLDKSHGCLFLAVLIFLFI